ncbi:MAG: hypothetical protein RL434_1615 [Pseudomonadota bacterium]
MTRQPPRSLAARLGLAGLLILPALVTAATRPGIPNRIVSLNLCTDSLLLEVAPRSAHLSLTRLSQDPGLSPLAAEASRHASNNGGVEEVVNFRPQLVLSANDSSPAVQLLQRLGYRVEIFPPAETLLMYEQALARLAGLLATEPLARQLLQKLHQRLQALPRLAAPTEVVLLSGNGYVRGEGTLSRELLAVVGLKDIGSRYTTTAQGAVPLEALVRDPPSWLVAGVASAGTPSLADEYLGHPALQSVFDESTRVIPLPEMLWTCGGSYFADAAEALSQALIRGGARVQP